METIMTKALLYAPTLQTDMGCFALLNNENCYGVEIPCDGLTQRTDIKTIICVRPYEDKEGKFHQSIDAEHFQQEYAFTIETTNTSRKLQDEYGGYEVEWKSDERLDFKINFVSKTDKPKEPYLLLNVYLFTIPLLNSHMKTINGSLSKCDIMLVFCSDKDNLSRISTKGLGELDIAAPNIDYLIKLYLKLQVKTKLLENEIKVDKLAYRVKFKQYMASKLLLKKRLLQNTNKLISNKIKRMKPDYTYKDVLLRNNFQPAKDMQGDYFKIFQEIIERKKQKLLKINKKLQENKKLLELRLLKYKLPSGEPNIKTVFKKE